MKVNRILVTAVLSVIIMISTAFSVSALKDGGLTNGSFTFYELSEEDGNLYLDDFVNYLRREIPSCFLLNYFVSYMCYSFGSQDIYVYYYYAFDSSVTSIDLMYNEFTTLDNLIAYGSSQLYVTDGVVTGFYSNSYSNYGVENPGSYCNPVKISLYKDGYADNSQSFVLNSQNIKVTVDGHPIGFKPISYNCIVNDDYTVDLTASTIDDSQKYRVIPRIHNQSTEPCEATHIPYSAVDDSSKYITPDDPYSLTIDLKDFQDKCQDMKTYSRKIYISFSIISEDYNEYGGYFAVDIENIMSTDTETKGLFTDKKEYESFPSISYYLEDDFPDIRDYVNFENRWDPQWVDVSGWDVLIDLIKNLIELIKSIGLFLYSYLLDPLLGFFLWLFAVLKYIFFNFIGLFEWLGACLWTIVRNIGIALYNLVVDLRRLVLYLFVPSSKNLYATLKDKFPSMARVVNAITAGKAESDKSMTLNLFGKDFDFNFSSIPDKLKTSLYTGSTICLYVIQAFIVIKCLFKCFGVHIGGGNDSEGE